MKATLLIGGRSDQHERKDSDFYPTPKECTIALMEFLKLPRMRIWEPACGDGAISKVLKSYGHFVTSTDKRIDSGYGEGGVDFLTANELTCDAIITNPPFNIAEDFINKSLNVAPLVCMILKATYWHAEKRFGLYERLKPAYIAPLLWRPNMCPERGKSPTMDFIWTVWIRGNEDAKYIPLKKPVIKEVKQKLLF